jgi:acetyl-CoA C-acetyltransferase
MERVAIMGARMMKAEACHSDKFYTEMIADTVLSLLQEIDMTRDELESVIGAGCDVQQGRSISNAFTVESMGGFMNEESKVEEDMAVAVMYAFMRIASGHFKNCLVCDYERGSEIHPFYLTGLQPEPIFMKPLGLDGLSIAALQATAFMAKYGVTREQAASMAAMDLRNAPQNPSAQRAMEVSVDEVLHSRELAFPITGLEYVPVSDGCVALMLAAEEVADKYTDTSVWIQRVNNPEKWNCEAAGAFRKPMFRIHTGGTVGAAAGIAGFYFVASGLFDGGLAVTGDKLSEGEVQMGLSTIYDLIFGRQMACGAPSAVALQASHYFHKYGVSEEQSAIVAVRNRKHAQNNPHSRLKMDLTVEDVMRSSYISKQIKLLDACPASDGAAVMVFAGEEKAGKLCPRSAWVRTVFAIAEGANYSYQNWAEPIVLIGAAKECYAECGITAPWKQLDVVEMDEAFSPQESLWAEALGLYDRGEGGRFIESGAASMEGELPINPSGGALSANTIGATAMVRQVEACLQVMGKAERRQAEGAKWALAHGWGGAIQFRTVMIVSSEEP